jgi:hypothetical protein
MKINSNRIQLSASDLSNFVACRHLIWLDLRAAHQEIQAPPYYEPTLVAIQERGLEFEKEYLEWSKMDRSGRRCLPVSLPGSPANFPKSNGAGSRE